MEDEIKRGLNVYLYYWTIPIFILFVVLNYFLKNVKLESIDMNLMISVVSFLFGFMITITFTLLFSKVNNLKLSLNGETARLVAMYNLSKHLGKKFHEKIAERIDEYTRKTLRDYTKYEIGRESMYGIYEDLALMEIENKRQEAAANSFLYVLGELQVIRENLESLTSRRTEWSLKFADYLLGFMLIALLFLNRGETFTNALFIILSTIVIFIFLIIEDYDNLKIGDYTYNISNSEQVFDLIGKDRYYPESVLSRTKLIEGKTYRISFMDKKTGEEKIASLIYNPGFKRRLNFLRRKVKA